MVTAIREAKGGREETEGALVGERQRDGPERSERRGREEEGG